MERLSGPPVYVSLTAIAWAIVVLVAVPACAADDFGKDCPPNKHFVYTRVGQIDACSQTRSRCVDIS
jgi:hypothetical protein